MKRPTHPTIVAYLALFAALGGSAYAAATIGSAEIKDNSIRGKDVRSGTITGREVKESKLQGVAGLDTYQVTKTATLTSPIEDVVSARATCSGRDRAVGGGIQAPTGTPGTAILRDGPLGARAWSGIARIPVTPPGVGRVIQVYAVCLRRPR